MTWEKDLSKVPDELAEQLIHYSVLAVPGDVVIIQARRDWSQAKIVGYMKILHEIVLGLGLRFSFMIVHGEEIESHAAQADQGTSGS